MLTIKAIIDARTSNSPDTYQLFEADSVRVEPSQVAGSNGPGVPAYIAPELCVVLYDKDRRILDSLHVGEGIDQWQTVYVMNAQGRTIQRVTVRSRDFPAAA